MEEEVKANPVKVEEILKVLYMKFSSLAASRRYKSVQRAVNRSRITPFGDPIPKRPFNNRKNTCKRGKNSRYMSTQRKHWYEERKKHPVQRESVEQ